MAEVTQEMMRAALNELEMRIMQNVSVAIGESERRAAESFQGTVAQSAATTLGSVDDAVSKALEAVKADTLARVDEAVTAELSKQALRVDGMFQAAADQFATERLETQQLVAKLEADIAAVSEGNMQRIAAKIATFEPRLLEMDTRDETRGQLLGQMHRESTERFGTAIADLTRRLDGQQEDLKRAYPDDFEAKNRIGALEEHVTGLTTRVSSIGASGFSGGGGGGGGPPRLRIPDPAGWKLQTYSGKQESFHTWRNEFEDAIGGVWLGLDKVLLFLRDIKEEVKCDRTFESAMSKAECVLPPGSNFADWSFEFLRRKLHGVMHSHLGLDPRKIVKFGDKYFFAT